MSKYKWIFYLARWLSGFTEILDGLTVIATGGFFTFNLTLKMYYIEIRLRQWLNGVKSED